jgi:NAD+ kinase
MKTSKIVIFVNTDKIHAEATAKKAAEILLGMGTQVETKNIDEVSTDGLNGVDIAIVIGGDGTILKAAGPASETGTPLLGINTGRLGFMASIERTELELLQKLSTGDYVISKRMRICGEVIRNGESVSSFAATNEISAIRPISKITDFTVFAANNRCLSENADAAYHMVSTFRADGVIVAAPTGSTAYALANGGAIVEPDANCMELTPIAAHTLSMRPIIFSGETVLKIKADLPTPFSESEPVSVVADGVSKFALRGGDEIIIKKSDKPLLLIDLKPNAFYESVNGKLFQSLK